MITILELADLIRRGKRMRAYRRALAAGISQADLDDIGAKQLHADTIARKLALG